MFAKIRMLFSQRDVVIKASIATHSPPGFHMPKSVSQLSVNAFRENCLQQIWENCSLPVNTYNQLYLTPLKLLLERVQDVPAVPQGRWSEVGGFGDLTLHFTTCAVKLAKGSLFPPGAAPEDQAAQSMLWNAVIYWSALFWHLPLLAFLEGEQVNGTSWQPGISVPNNYYRFRYRAVMPVGNEATALAAIMASQLMPADALSWVAEKPEALRNLSGMLWNQHSAMPLIRNLMKQAAEMAESPLAHDGNTETESLKSSKPAEIHTPPPCSQESSKKDEGERFFHWLRAGIVGGEISINGRNDKIHIIAGYTFLPVPDIFLEYLKTINLQDCSRETLQASFERLRLYKRKDNKRFYLAHHYEAPNESGRFKRVKGYLVSNQQIFGTAVPQDSEYLIFP
jgi:integrating conjugative element relaxase (TIGR03760 family)